MEPRLRTCPEMSPSGFDNRLRRVSQLLSLEDDNLGARAWIGRPTGGLVHGPANLLGIFHSYSIPIA